MFSLRTQLHMCVMKIVHTCIQEKASNVEIVVSILHWYKGLFFKERFAPGEQAISFKRSPYF